MHRKKLLVSAVLALGLIGAGCSLTQTVNLNTSATNANTVVRVCAQDAESCRSYDGQDGQTALALLQAKFDVDASDQGFVNAINDVKPDDRQFWAFYVDGQQASVGAKDYVTKNGQRIEWKLEGY